MTFKEAFKLNTPIRRSSWNNKDLTVKPSKKGVTLEYTEDGVVYYYPLSGAFLRF